MNLFNGSRGLALLVVAGAATSRGQTLSITNGTDAGTISFSSVVNHDFTNVWNGYHTGIVCNTNSDCAVDGEITFTANTSYTEAKSEVFLTSWAFNNGVSTGDEIGRVKAVVEQRSYDPTTGVYKWRAALRLDTTTSSTFTAAYGIAIYRGSSSSKITITKNLNKSCTGNAGCSVMASTNVVNVQPAGNNTFKGFLGRGFDLKTISGNKGTLQRIYVDVGSRAAGTTSGGYAGQYNQKQGMNCGFEIVSSLSTPDLEDVSCTTYAVALRPRPGMAAMRPALSLTARVPTILLTTLSCQRTTGFSGTPSRFHQLPRVSSTEDGSCPSSSLISRTQT